MKRKAKKNDGLLSRNGTKITEIKRVYLRNTGDLRTWADGSLINQRGGMKDKDCEWIRSKFAYSEPPDRFKYKKVLPCIFVIYFSR
jgi:hypothetical protein